VPPDTTVADFVDVAGALVVGVVVVAVVADVDAVLPELDEATVVPATVAVPGISFETTSPSTAADPAATIARVLDMRRTFVAATSRRLASSWPCRDSDPLA
jgi:Cu/Ag efflux pump CusA